MKKSSVLSIALSLALAAAFLFVTPESGFAQNAAQAIAPPANVHISDAAVTKPVNVHVVARHANGSVFYDNWVHNLRTTGGADWQAAVMGNAGSQPAAANYIALSNNSVAPAAGDCAAGSSTCTLSGEISSNGLARHAATYSHSNGTNVYSDTYTWTASGTQSVQEAGWFNASSSGTMVFEAAFSQVNLVATDTFTATWTVTY